MIFGRVIDDDGEPVASAVVSVGKRVWIRGQRQLQIMQGTTSQADGSFVLGNLASGNYFLSAKGNMRPPIGEVFVENFFPNTPEVQTAAPISVAAGAEVRGLTLRVRSTRIYSIRGKATNSNGEEVNGVPLMLMRTTGLNHGSISSAGTRGGLFEFRNVAPGNYVIQAVPFRNRDGTASSLTAHVPIAVGEGDVEDLQLTLGPGLEIPGIVRLNDDISTQNFGLNLLPVDTSDFNGGAIVKDGTFTFRSVAPARYRIQAQNLLSGYCIKSMRFAGRDLVRRELDLSAGASGTLEIQLTDKPAVITGMVRDSNGEPMADVAVSAWSKDDPEIRGARTDASGHFTLRDFISGDYRVIAWESIDFGVVENPEFRAAFENQATVVTAQEGSQATADLKVVSKSAVDAEIAKLP
jgi:hypothetical protein